MHPPYPADLTAADGSRDNDAWFNWLLSVRHGGNVAYAAALAPMLEDIRDRLLDNARLAPNERIADIGCGDGLAGLGALERQPTSIVTFADISPALIDYTRTLAERRGLAARCRFLVASAQALGAIPDASIDVVLVRAVLAYIDDKGAALREFRRILRPRGRISIVDPIFQDGAFAVAGLASQRNAGNNGLAARYLELLHRCRSAHLPDSVDEIGRNSLTNYNERDLLRLFESAGFVNVHLRLHIDSIPALPMPWLAFLASSPRAQAPTMGEILGSQFTSAERIEFEQIFRANIEAGTTIERNVNAYIFADSP